MHHVIDLNSLEGPDEWTYLRIKDIPPGLKSMAETEISKGQATATLQMKRGAPPSPAGHSQACGDLAYSLHDIKLQNHNIAEWKRF